MVSCRLVVKKGNHTFSDVYFFFMPGLIILFIRSGRDWPFSSAATRHPLYLSWPTRPPNPTERMPLLPGLVYRLFVPFAIRQDRRVCHWLVRTRTRGVDLDPLDLDTRDTRAPAGAFNPKTHRI